MYGIGEVHVDLLFLHMFVRLFLLRLLLTNTFKSSSFTHIQTHIVTQS